MNNLIDRLKAAKVGSRELDAEIAKAIKAPQYAIDDPDVFIGKFSTSIDAALTLRGEGLSWFKDRSGFIGIYHMKEEG